MGSTVFDCLECAKDGDCASNQKCVKNRCRAVPPPPPPVDCSGVHACYMKLHSERHLIPYKQDFHCAVNTEAAKRCHVRLKCYSGSWHYGETLTVCMLCRRQKPKEKKCDSKMYTNLVNAGPHGAMPLQFLVLAIFVWTLH